MPKVMAYVWFLTKEQSQIEFRRMKNPEFWDTERKEHNLCWGPAPKPPGFSALVTSQDFLVL
jgi:hypothetical protein